MKLDSIVPSGGSHMASLDEEATLDAKLVNQGRAPEGDMRIYPDNFPHAVPHGPPHGKVMTIAGDGKDGAAGTPNRSSGGTPQDGSGLRPKSFDQELEHPKRLARLSTTNNGAPLPTTLLARRRSMRRLSMNMNKDVGIGPRGDDAVETITGFIIPPMNFDEPQSARKSAIKRSVFDEKESGIPLWKLQVMKHVDGPILSTFMTIVTIWALWGDDIRLMSTWKKDDDYFVALTWFCLVCFAAELIAASLAKPGYFMGFYFYLDFIATASLLFDIPLIWNKITGGPADDEEDDSGGGGSNAAAESTTLARAGRTSRAGTRAGRIVRLVRLIRIVKLYKQWQAHKQGKETNKVYVEEEDMDMKQSKVGEKLSDLTTRRVIIGVLTMLFLLPVFDLGSGYFYEPVPLQNGGLDTIHEAFQALSGPWEARIYDPAFKKAWEILVENLDTGVTGRSRVSLLRINGTDVVDSRIIPPKHALRDDEKETYSYKNSRIRLNLRWESEKQAVLNFCRTIFICIILGAGAMLFSKDANNLVLLPIERMMKKVKDVSENPLNKLQVDDNDGQDEEFETRILENSITKICSLMAVGFGDAGAEIIAENMKQAGDLNPMVPGKKVFAIFGFCDIRQFTDTTEILQEGVMEFVNSIAKIVHLEVALHEGSANKNIGDAFLLVWKFPSKGDNEMQAELVKSGGDFTQLPAAKLEMVNSLADKALAAFAIVMAGLRRSQRLQRYQVNPKLVQRMPGYQVKMGFGLHVGWAIEGAIGSEYKVDASYLSPNVNMASRLEAATKQFGVPILISSDFVKLLSEYVREMVRQIDVVTVKGSKQPMGLYTFDVEPECIEEAPLGRPGDKPIDDDTPSFDDYEMEFLEHPDLVAMRMPIKEDFLRLFTEGFVAYRDGNWSVAKEILDKCLWARYDVHGNAMEDGPSNTLLGVMKEHNFVAPPSWEGFRELTEK